MEAGIETVYQDLALVDTMSAYQYVYLGRKELSKNPIARFFNSVDDRLMRQRAREVLDSLAVKVPSINVSVKGMSGGQRQCLAISRALLWGWRIVILDEPTAALGVRETAQVLDAIRDPRNHDVSVIVVSHNMQQLMGVADRITVMRLGRSIATRTVNQTEVSEIVGLITGAIPGDAEEGAAYAVSAAEQICPKKGAFDQDVHHRGGDPRCVPPSRRSQPRRSHYLSLYTAPAWRPHRTRSKSGWPLAAIPAVNG